MTVDKLLLKIVNSNSPTIEEILTNRDCKVLRSLATGIFSDFFITENQSRLLLKILRENAEKITNFKEEIYAELVSPVWSQRFRQIEQVKKVYLRADAEGELQIIIEFTFSSHFRQILSNLSKIVENLEQSSPGKSYTAELTEQNIVKIVDSLLPLNFDIDATVKSHYETIKSWSKTQFESQFLVTNIVYPNFIKHITDDLGIETTIDQNIIKDRSVRYQYLIENEVTLPENLTKTIAYREKSKIWIDKNSHSLSDVISSLITLRRLPVMIVFDVWDEVKNIKNLKVLSDAIENCGLYDNVGIYFRMPGTEQGKEFNQFIADRQYNKKLDSDTKLVAVQSGKIPKFFLSTQWRPMSVITLDSNMGLRHSKTSVYTNCCDLIIEYADQPALAEPKVLVW